MQPSRRTFLMTSGAVAGAIALPTIVAAKPMVTESPLFAECEHLTQISVFVDGRITFTLLKTEDYPRIAVRSLEEAEDYFFERVGFLADTRGGPLRHVGYSRLVTASSGVAVASRRGEGNLVFARSSVLEHIGMVREDVQVGRWTRYRLPDQYARSHRIRVGYGTDDHLPHGNDLIVAYVGSKFDAPGVIRKHDDGSFDLVLQPKTTNGHQSGLSYATRIDPPRHLLDRYS